MRAVLFEQPGAPDVLTIGDADTPVAGADELLIRVHATAINRADLLQRRGAYPPPAGASPILGLEVAGEVVTPARDWRIGDRVMAVVTGGGYAERAVVPASTALRIPDNVSYEQAAALPEAFMTAFLNLFTMGHFVNGERVLIHAAGSGVGTAAIQLAKVAGAAQIFVTAGSDDKLSRCSTLGADILINYKTASFRQRVADETQGAGVDVILDFIGAPYWNDNLGSLAQKGRLLLIGSLGGVVGDLNIAAIMGKRLTITGTTLRRTALSEKVALVRAMIDFGFLTALEQGMIRPIIDRVYNLHEVVLAHHHMESNSNFGKIVLKLI